MEYPNLQALGERIMVCGPSNSGKSTLAAALARHLGSQCVYLDLLFHLPNTDWVARPKDEFVALHDAAIAGERWIIEGNYFGTIRQRMDRATGIILLGSEPVRSALRNVRRTLFESGRRAGQLEGNIDRLNWPLFHYILFEQPRKQERDRDILRSSGRLMVELNSMRELNRLYAQWGLTR